MQKWARNRGNAYEHSFQASLAALGIKQQAFDAIAPKIDEAVCGSSDQNLDLAYPPLANLKGRRLILTDAAPGVPPLRISFYVEQGTGKIIYEDVDLR